MSLSNAIQDLKQAPLLAETLRMRRRYLNQIWQRNITVRFTFFTTFCNDTIKTISFIPFAMSISFRKNQVKLMKQQTAFYLAKSFFLHHQQQNKVSLSHCFHLTPPSLHRLSLTYKEPPPASQALWGIIISWIT